MNRVAPVVGALAVLLVVTVSAHSKPDFSGKWAAVASTGGGTGVPLTVVQDETTITISSPSDRGDTDRLSLKLDGSPGKYGLFRPDGTIREHDAKAEWSGTKLVVTRKAYSNGLGDYTIKSTWSRDGDRLEIETVMTRDANGAPISSGTATFRKQ